MNIHRGWKATQDYLYEVVSFLVKLQTVHQKLYQQFDYSWITVVVYNTCFCRAAFSGCENILQELVLRKFLKTLGKLYEGICFLSRVADSRDTISVKKVHYDIFQDYSYRFKTAIFNHLHFEHFFPTTCLEQHFLDKEES